MYVNKLINGCHFLDNKLNWIIYQKCIIFSLKTSEYLFSAKKSSSKTFFFNRIGIPICGLKMILGLIG